MPFNGRVRPFTREDIELLQVGRVGVFGVFREGQWIYIGSGDIRSNLLSIYFGHNREAAAEKPTHWIAEYTNEYEGREKQLIDECKPPYSRKVGYLA